MNRATKKALALAVGGFCLAGLTDTVARAATDIWTTTVGSQDWSTATNWSNGIPGSGDLATFTTNVPPSNTVTFSQANTNVGAIIDNLANVTAPPNSKGAALTLGGNTTLDLFGQTYTAGETVGTFTFNNVILANTSAPTSNTDTMTLNSGVNLNLMGAANTIVTSVGGGANAGETITINGSISDGPGVSSSLTLLQGGNSSLSGGTTQLYGSNSFSGGITVGNTAGTQGGALEIRPDNVTLNAGGTLTSVNANNTGTGNVLINEQGQLLLDGPTSAGTAYFMQAGQTLTLNGIGENKNSSGNVRTVAESKTAFPQTYDVLANVVFGTAAASDLTNGYIIITSTTSPLRTILLSGVVSGTGNFQKQGAGNLEFSNPSNTWSGATQIGNGSLTIDPGSNLGGGDLIMLQTSTNTTVLNAENATLNVGSLSSNFTDTINEGSATVDDQTINLFGTAGVGNLNGTPGSGTNLVLNQHSNTQYGYSSTAGLNTLSSIIQGPGKLTLSAASTGILTLNGFNIYTGGTFINGGTLNVANGAGGGAGSATGSGDVTVNAGGKLISGNNAVVLGQAMQSGSIGGNVNLNAGGILSPGGDGLVGSMEIAGNLNANNGSIINMDLIGGTSASADEIDVTGALTVTNTSDLNIVGSKLAFGNYTLFTVGSLTGGVLPTLNSVPSPSTRNYALDSVGNAIVLEITNTSTDRFWSVGGVNPPADGAGTWAAGSTNFFVQSGTVGQTQVPYSNTSTADLVIGNAGNGGAITLGGNVIVGGPLVFSPVASAYTIAGSSSLQVNGGIIGSNSATITAPVVLGASQSFTAAPGMTLTIANGISQTGGSQSLTTLDLGTVVIGGTSTYTGGTTVSQGTLQITTASLPTTGGVSVALGADLVFSQASNGAYSGQISGAGTVTIDNAGSAVTVLNNAGNSYTGQTAVEGGVLNVTSVGALGSGDGGLLLEGGTLQAGAANIDFPLAGLNTSSTFLTLAAATSSVIDTNGFDLTMGEIVQGSGNLTKIGGGTLTLQSLHSTNVIGALAITGGALAFDEGGNPSFGFSASSGATNTFTGDLDIQAPTDLRIYSGNVSGGGNINIAASANGSVIEGRDENNNFLTFVGNPINLNVGGAGNTFLLNLEANGVFDTLQIAAPITGPGSVDFTGGSGVVLLSVASSYTGGTTVDESSGGFVRLGINNALPTATAVHVTGSGVLDLNGFNQSIASLDASNATAEIINDGTANSVLTISGSTATTYAGFLLDGPTNSLGLTLDGANTGSLTLSGNNQTVNGPVGLSGPIDIIGGQLDVQTATGLGAPGTITVGSIAGNSQLRLDGVMGTLTYSSSANPSVPASQVQIILNGLGGYTSFGGLPGAIDVGNGSNVSIPSAITLAATSSINIGSNSTLTLTNTISGPGGLLIEAFKGGGTLNFTVSNTYGGGTTITGSTVNVLAGGALPVGGVVANGSILNILATSSIGQITGTGALTLANSASLQIAGVLAASTVGSININSGSTLDLTNNKLVINYGSPGADPIATIESQLVSGRNSGAWNGTGIDSSAITNGHFALGYADSDNGDSAVGLAANQIIVKYTLAGDANLANSVGIGDLLIVAQNFGKTGKDWAHGNFTYDPAGAVGIADLLLVAQNFSKSSGVSEGGLGSGLSPAWQSVSSTPTAYATPTTAVPEPGAIALVLAGAGSLLARRRRKA